MNTHALAAAVMTKLQGDSTLLGLAPGNTHLHAAPEGIAEPYNIVTPQIELPTQEQTSKTEAYRRGRFQVKSVHTSPSGATAQLALNRIDALLNGGTLTITGYHFMDCRQVESNSYIERDGQFIHQHRWADYEVTADPI